MNTAASRYDKVSIWLHWSIGIAIIVIAAIELLRGELFAKGSFLREGLKALHDPAGTVVFALIVVRLAWRSVHAAPAMPDSMRPWEKLAARLTHYALYVMMILIPLGGIAYTFARGRPIDFGLFQIASPFGQSLSRETIRSLKGFHEFLGQAILVVAFFHAVAALWHHYIRKDNVLVRMLPKRWAPVSSSPQLS